MHLLNALLKPHERKYKKRERKNIFLSTSETSMASTSTLMSYTHLTVLLPSLPVSLVHVAVGEDVLAVPDAF